MDEQQGISSEEIPKPYHRWAINEDPYAPNRHQTSKGQPDHCLVCGVVRYPLSAWAQELAAGPCPERPWKDVWAEEAEL